MYSLTDKLVDHDDMMDDNPAAIPFLNPMHI